MFGFLIMGFWGNLEESNMIKVVVWEGAATQLTVVENTMEA